MATSPRFEDNPHWLPRQPASATEHIPGEDGWPLVGTTLEQLKDPQVFTRRMQTKYGNVYRAKSFGGRGISLIGPNWCCLTGTRFFHRNRAGVPCSTCSFRAG